MTDEEIIRRLKNIRRALPHNTKEQLKDDTALTWAIECVRHKRPRGRNYKIVPVKLVIQEGGQNDG